MSRIRVLSADEESHRLSFVRERALRDEVSLLNDARREGVEEGEYRRAEQIARNLIARTEMDDGMIAEVAGLPVDEVAGLRAESRH